MIAPEYLMEVSTYDESEGVNQLAKKTTRSKKTTAKKSGKKKTTARASSTAVVVDEKLAKRVIKARANGDGWVEIREAEGLTRGQINPLRKLMRELDPESVQASGPRGEGRTAKRTTKKSTSEGGKKKRSKKTTGRKKKGGGRKKGQRLNLSELSDSALISALVGRRITFRINKGSTDPVTKTVRFAKMLPESEKFGRVIQLKMTDQMTHSVAESWIERVR